MRRRIGLTLTEPAHYTFAPGACRFTGPPALYFLRIPTRAQANMATEETTTAPSAWLHAQDADPGRPQSAQSSPSQGSAQVGRLASGQVSERRIRQTLGRDQRIRRKSDFEALRERGISRAHPLLVLRAAPNGLPYARFGFVVGRRVAAKAVDRNRVRRRLREIARRNAVRGGWDLLFIARHAAVGVDFKELVAAVLGLERRVGLVESGEGSGVGGQ
jgi:ribonuclease P protein component